MEGRVKYLMSGSTATVAPAADAHAYMWAGAGGLRVERSFPWMLSLLMRIPFVTFPVASL